MLIRADLKAPAQIQRIGCQLLAMQRIFFVTITSGLSGSYNSACIAKGMYEAEHPDRRVFVIDSLSAGPELTLIVEKLEEMIGEGMPYEEICSCISDYQKKTGLLFILESLNHFAANGRVSPAVAKIVGVLAFILLARPALRGLWNLRISVGAK